MTKKTPPKEETGVTVSFFRGSAGKLWLTLLILSPLFAAAFAVFAFLYADDGMIVIIGCCVIAAIALIVFGVCVGTAGTRTSRWTADETGVSYYRLGRKVVSIGWEEMREAGFLYLGGALLAVAAVLVGGGTAREAEKRKIRRKAGGPRREPAGRVHDRLYRSRLLWGGRRGDLSHGRSVDHIHARAFQASPQTRRIFNEDQGIKNPPGGGFF